MAPLWCPLADIGLRGALGPRLLGVCLAAHLVPYFVCCGHVLCVGHIGCWMPGGSMAQRGPLVTKHLVALLVFGTSICAVGCYRYDDSFVESLRRHALLASPSLQRLVGGRGNLPYRISRVPRLHPMLSIQRDPEPYYGHPCSVPNQIHIGMSPGANP